MPTFRTALLKGHPHRGFAIDCFSETEATSMASALNDISIEVPILESKIPHDPDGTHLACVIGQKLGAFDLYGPYAQMETAIQVAQTNCKGSTWFITSV